MSDNNHTHDTTPMTEGDYMTSYEDYQFAGFWMRFWAYLTDLLIVFGVTTVLLGPLNLAINLKDVAIGPWTVHVVLATVILYGYFLLMTRFLGQTLGKMIFGLRVIHISGTQPQWPDLMFREVIGRFIQRVFFFMNVLYIIVGFTKQKEGIHDIVGNTRVVHETKK